jgi:Protein of unknown function (DUF3489)
MASAANKECIAMTKSRKNPTKSGSRARKSTKPNSDRRGPTPSPTTKTATLLQLLSKTEGVTVAMMAHAVGWQNHSVRGFLAGQVRKLGLEVSSEKGADGVRRYRTIQN